MKHNEFICNRMHRHIGLLRGEVKRLNKNIYTVILERAVERRRVTDLMKINSSLVSRLKEIEEISGKLVAEIIKLRTFQEKE